MWIDPKMLSRWAYYECLKCKNYEINNLITDSKWSYLYCKTIKDDEEIRNNIKDSEWAFKYLKNINKNNEEMKKIIKGSEWEYWLN